MVTHSGPNGTIELTIENNVAELRGTNSEKRNCISFDMVEDFHHHVKALESRKDEIYSIVMTHAGDVYCAGYDLDVISSDDEDQKQQLWDTYDACESWIIHSDIPVIVGADGPAVAKGAGHLLLGDIIVAGPDLRVWWSEINVGLFPHTMAASFIERYGIRRAAELTFLGNEAKLTPEECREMGLINRIVDSDDVDETVRHMGATLAEYERKYGYMLDAYEIFNLVKREKRITSNAGTALGSWLGTYDEWFGDSDPRTGGKDDPRGT